MKSSKELENLRKALTVWDPDDTDVWTPVGMAIKAAGYDFSVWDEWSRNGRKYNDKGNHELMERKWKSFSDTERPGDFTIASIFWKARQNGLTFEGDAPGETEPSWENQIMQCDDYIASCYKDGAEPVPHTPGELQHVLTFPFLDLPAWLQLLVYFKTLYDDTDTVGIVNAKSTVKTGGKWGPRYPKIDDGMDTVGHITDILTTHALDRNVVTQALGELNPQAGAWITLNSYKVPHTANDTGVFAAENAVTFRYALIESDTMDVTEQIKFCMRHRLPVMTVTLSGGKSAHIIVRVDAVNLEQYRDRVAFLYDYLKAAGMDLDPQDKNVNRLTRLPGVKRDGKDQTLVLVRNMLPTCCKTWDEWETYAKAHMKTSQTAAAPSKGTDGKDGKKELPTLPVLHTQGKETAPEKDVELLEGVMLKGGIMEVIAPPKAGKTHFMMQMGMSIAQGLPFLGYNTTKCKVFYANMELSPRQFERRMYKLKNDIFKDQPEEIRLDKGQNFLDAPLKGMGLNITTFVDALIEQQKGTGIEVIVIDPIYPLMDGDENGTPAWRAAIKELDRLSKEMGDVTVVYVHHTTKGETGAKNKRDQGAGSGMQTRHGDEIIALMELEVSDELRDQLQWDPRVKAYELAFTSRDFDPAPKRIYFKDGVFYEDTDGVLKDCSVIGSDEYMARKASDVREKTRGEKTDARKKKALKQEQALIDAMEKVLTNALPQGGTASEIAGEILTMPEGKGETLSNLRIQVSSYAAGLPDRFTKTTDEKNHVIIALNRTSKDE